MTKVITNAYTEDILKSLTKPQIIDLFIKRQEHTNSTVSEFNDEIKNLNANFKSLDSFHVKTGKKRKQCPSETGSFPWMSIMENAQYLQKEWAYFSCT